MRDHTPDNPIYRVRQAGVMREVVANTPDRYIVDQLEAIRQQLTSLSAPCSRGRTLIPRGPGGRRIEMIHHVQLAVEGTEEQLQQFKSIILEQPGWELTDILKLPDEGTSESFRWVLFLAAEGGNPLVVNRIAQMRAEDAGLTLRT
jgi:hypothetical protein